MAELNHTAAAVTGSEFLTTSTTFVDVSTSAEVPAGSLIGGDEYLYMFGMGVGSNNTASNQNEVAVAINGTEITESIAIRECAQAGPQSTEPYFFLHKHTQPGTPVSVRHRYRNVGGSNSCRVRDPWSVAINLTELGASNYAWNEDTTGGGMGTTFTGYQSVTIGDGTSDWIVFWCMQVDCSTTSSDMRVHVNVGGSTICEQRYEGEDTIEQYVIGGAVLVSAPNSTAVTVEARADNTGSPFTVLNGRIFAIKLDAFEDSFASQSFPDTSITTVDTDFVVHTATHTTATGAARSWHFGGHGVYDPNGEATKRQRYEIYDNTLGETLAGDGAASAQTLMVGNGIVELRGWTVGQTRSTTIANGTALDIDAIVQEDADVSPAPIQRSSLIYGWTWELASTGVTGSLSKTLGAVTSDTPAGTVDVDGTASPTLGALTDVSDGTVDVDGSTSRTLDALISSSAVDVEIAAALSLTTDAASLSSTYEVAAAAAEFTSAISAADASLSSTSAILVSATSSITNADASQSSAATVSVDGTTASTLAALTDSSAGTVDVDGTSAVTLGALSSSSAGDVLVTADVTQTAADATLVSTYNIGVIAEFTAVISASDASISSAATVDISGTVARTLDAATAASAGTVDINGTVAQTLATATLSSQATVDVAADVSVSAENASLVSDFAVTSGAVSADVTLTTGDASLSSQIGEEPVQQPGGGGGWNQRSWRKAIEDELAERRRKPKPAKAKLAVTLGDATMSAAGSAEHRPLAVVIQLRPNDAVMSADAQVDWSGVIAQEDEDFELLFG